jgi:CHAT domain-containing protein
VLKREGEPKCIDLGPAADIDRVVSLVRKALVDRGSLNAKEAGRSLDELLMRPVRKLIGETRHILLSPDGLINLLPFSALVDEDGRYLIENYVLSYLTSGRDLLRLDIRGLKSKQGPIVFANPAYEVLDSPSMPSNSANTTTNALLSSSTAQMQWEALEGTEEEANSLKDILRSARIITGTNASEAALKRITAPRILHIATHGFFLPGRFPGDWPLLRSGLVLAGANQRHSGTGEDGLLTALEAAQLDLWGTQLVVLSACQTGLGDIQIGEGVYGLRRALGLAGAESQLMSLWRVDDEATRELMVQYYRRLRDGVGRTEALREVQLGMLRSKSRSHPFFWSGFIPIGDWRMLDRL